MTFMVKAIAFAGLQQYAVVAKSDVLGVTFVKCLLYLLPHLQLHHKNMR